MLLAINLKEQNIAVSMLVLRTKTNFNINFSLCIIHHACIYYKLLSTCNNWYYFNFMFISTFTVIDTMSYIRKSTVHASNTACRPSRLKVKLTTCLGRSMPYKYFTEDIQYTCTVKVVHVHTVCIRPSFLPWGPLHTLRISSPFVLREILCTHS